MKRLNLILSGLGVFSLLAALIGLLFLGSTPLILGLFGVAAACFAAALFRARATVFDFLTLRTTRNGMSMGATLLLVMVILVSINFLSVRNNKSWDITKEGLNSLSEQSLSLLKSLDSELLIRFFYDEGNQPADVQRNLFRDLARKYEQQSSFLKLQFVEINKRPDLTEEYRIKEGAGVVFMDYKGQRKRIDEISEQAFTQTLSNLIYQINAPIYFLEGHGERSIEDSRTEKGLGVLKGALEGAQFKVSSLSLLNSEKIPDDAKVIVVSDPQTEVLEQQVLIDYLEKGGSMVVTLEPTMDKNYDRRIGTLLAKYGVQFSPKFIALIFGNQLIPNQTPGRLGDRTHPILKLFDEKATVIFNTVGGLRRVEGSPTDLEYRSLLRSFDSIGIASRPDFKDVERGEVFDFAVIVEKSIAGSDKKARLMVVSDSDFWANPYFESPYMNKDFVMNSLSYLAGVEQAITIRPKSPEKTDLVATSNSLKVLATTLWIPLPLLMLALAVFLFFRKRAS